MNFDIWLDSPSLRPLPSGERGRVRGADLREFIAFVLVPVHFVLQRSLFVIEASVGILARCVYPQSEKAIQFRVRIRQEQTPVTTGQGKDKNDD